MFVHLHNHSHYSILEGLPKPKDYVKKVKEFGMEAVAITDTGNIYGCHELYKEAKYAGIKPILGTEIFVESFLDPNINHKLVLLAKSLNGYRNILTLVTKANLDINNSKVPRIKFSDFEELKKEKNDLELVALSGPIAGEIPFFILSGKSDEEILKRIKKYEEVFGEENYYLELMYHDDIPKQKLITDKLIELANKYDLNVVATNNCYYIDTQDKQTQDVIMALGTGHELENPDRPTMRNGDYSFLSETEMQKLFGFIPQALENSVKIANMVNIEIETGGILIPVYELPEEDRGIYERAKRTEKDVVKGSFKKLTSDEWYLRYLSFSGLNWRYKAELSEEIIFKLVQKLDEPPLQKKLTETSPEELKTLSLTYYSEEKKDILKTFSQDLQDKIERLEYELVVVHEMGYNAYFLIVADYINWARKNDIPVGPGRGSAAGSLMAYLTGITDIDPLPYKLLFERFLNPARVSMPDIDTDFADTERDRVVDYCRKKYGEDRVVQICTFGTFAARAAVKDVGRVFGVPFSEMNELAKLIPEKPGTKLVKALEESVEFKTAYDNNPLYKSIVDNALKIEGNVRQLGVHACAVIIAPEPMTNFTALQHPPKDTETIVTQYSAYPLEDLGLLKMDFLGLRNLTIIKRAQKIIKNTKGVDIDVLNLDLNDQKVFEIFANGDTTGVFQFESDGMRKYLKDLAPDSFEDLIAMVSLYRPGPIAYIPTYIDVKFGRKEKKYLTDELIEKLKEAGYSEEEIQEEGKKLDEDLSGILDITYGIAVYQEQLMFIVQYMAGFSLGEADLLRRGVGKKKHDVIEALKKEFIEKGATYRQYKPETTNYIYTEMIMPAANYSFNKSHAACYALIAYQTAYLKAYYKTEFLTSVMVSDENNVDRITLEVAECEASGISIMSPSINESMKHFTYIDDKHIRFGLKALKGIGDGPIDKIIETREKAGGRITSLEQFVKLGGKDLITKKVLDALIFSGAMDELGLRGPMIKSIEEIMRFARRDSKTKESNQIGLFDESSDFADSLELLDVPDLSFEEKLYGERLMIGFLVSGHPLDGLKKYCARRSQNTKKLKMSLEELEKLERPPLSSPYQGEEGASPLLNKERIGGGEKGTKDYKQQEKVQVVGVIIDVRKTVTKTGQTMMFLKCEGFDYDFDVTVFPKETEMFKNKLELDKVIIVSGFLDINFEFKRKTIKAKDIKIQTISATREQARDLGLFDNSKRYVNLSLNMDLVQSSSESLSQFSPHPPLNSPPEGEKRLRDETQRGDTKEETQEVEEFAFSNGESEDFEEVLEDKIKENKVELDEKIREEKFVIKIPQNAVKSDLFDLKEFIANLKNGSIKIFLDLRGQEIDTKVSLASVDSLEEWIIERWG